MNDAKDIAKYIIAYWNQHDREMSNLKLQKVLYFAWSAFYAATERYLFENPFYASTIGPMCRDIYYDYCSFGSLPIRALFSDSFTLSCPIEFQDKEILDRVLKPYLDVSPFYLNEPNDLINKENTPWGRAFSHGCDTPIEFSDIIKYEPLINQQFNNVSDTFNIR